MKKHLCVLLIAVLATVALTADPIAAAEREEPMKIRFEELKPFIAMGLENQSSMEGDGMMNVWTKFFSIQDNLPEPVGNCIYGIYYPGEKFDPATMQGLNYFVGMEVKDAVKLPEDLQMHKVAGGNYAVFEYIGDIKGIGKAYEYIYGEWLLSGNYKPSSVEMFERYDERFKEDSPESLVEIWIPVQKMEMGTAPEDAVIKDKAPNEKP